MSLKKPPKEKANCSCLLLKDILLSEHIYSISQLSWLLEGLGQETSAGQEAEKCCRIAAKVHIRGREKCLMESWPSLWAKGGDGAPLC